MTREESVQLMTDKMARFVGHIGKKLPDDVIAKLKELGEKEDAPLPKVLYATMTKNQNLAVALDRPQLSGHRCASVLGKMRHRFPTD